MVFPNNDYNSTTLATSNGNYVFTHSAFGAHLYHYSWNFGRNWTSWHAWEDVTTIKSAIFDDPGNFWAGKHIMMQCKCHQYDSLVIDPLILHFP